MDDLPQDDSVISLTFDCLRAEQPIGDVFICSVPHEKLRKITYFDVRRVLQDERDVERYLGIQRPLDDRRVKKIEDYVNFFDASFPTGIIVAVDEDYASYDEKSRTLTVSNTKHHEQTPSINISNIARVIDGQHRIAGLANYKGKKFDLPVIFFVGSDISDQAHIFSTVNLEQTKVHKNLVYDLYSLARSRSPQKTCHQIAVALDQDEDGPLYGRIKRLGGATIGRDFEPISQATFVESLMRYISLNPKNDRDKLLRNEKIPLIDGNELRKTPLRNLFIQESDLKIAEAIHSLFAAVRDRWPDAWNDESREGLMLNRTNGFRAIMRLYSVLYEKHGLPGGVVPKAFIDNYLNEIKLDDQDFDTKHFIPGSGGEGRLFRVLSKEETLEEQKAKLDQN
ncbi:DGQHR domain-containing protein [Yoonia rosea]|uniref:DGQHR domain-containing protein n=1 Tax=Yoonia rosea TaxID=287098 RepID=A0A1R3WTB1_9RHOB|nr:DGQHR domain-containing protein [Yoonia rosea]SIT81165.1 DGQHR domain-containing protein [Yoonia rosea]